MKLGGKVWNTLFASLVCVCTFANEHISRELVETEAGSTTFEVDTNMPGIEVKGKSSALSARAEISRGPNGLIIQRISGSVPVDTLLTGMKVRDEHMRKYIFTTSDGQRPDLRFSAEQSMCVGTGKAHEFSCEVKGELIIRGNPRPFAMTLSVKEDGAGSTYHASGMGAVKLSEYGITRPSQFGVTPADNVKIRVDFTGRQKPGVLSDSGAAQ